MATIAIAVAIGCGDLSAWAAAGSNTVQRALDKALLGTNAVGVVLDGADGRLLGVVRTSEAGRGASAPGSTLKPLFLAAALHAGRVRPETTVACHGNLKIAGRNLACTHPREQNTFDAERALAYSCNTWFANLARRFSPREAVDVLHAAGFGSRTGLIAAEAAGNVEVPGNDAEVQLLVLGLSGIRVTPVQLAQAYLWLAQRVDATPVVRRGLEGSVAYGMAHNAATTGITIAGKTGTASDVGAAWTHGWFAGIASRSRERVVVVIYVPRGNGADAAGLAHQFFALWGREQ
ncbi:MAG TPA: penicillin-binding transpeptidase domain-containing protein [Acidobacteriaceae bacterium]|nr:penicillin-binding transpeptidase domain-containing protein [Acidobacteriaceae bacterium]